MTHDLQYEKLQKDCEMFLLANVKCEIIFCFGAESFPNLK